MTQSMSRGCRGLRVLVAEDNILIGEFVRQILVDVGYTVVGPFESLEGVLEAVQLEQIDGALLDLDLDGVSILPAASALAARNVPFILVSGQRNTADLPPLLAGAPLLTKPFDVAGLERLVLGAFGPRCAA